MKFYQLLLYEYRESCACLENNYCCIQLKNLISAYVAYLRRCNWRFNFLILKSAIKKKEKVTRQRFYITIIIIHHIFLRRYILLLPIFLIFPNCLLIEYSVF